ncbi:putative inner membrane protein [bacterium BMS3Abin04]|nr:putative inner membrane protein [bacterium BMS3Abin04]
MTNIKVCQLKKAMDYFNYPPQLTAKERDVMRQRKMKKHDVAIMLVHWFNAITWILMLATGGALIISAFYKFAPDFYISIVRGMFGTPGNLIEFHIWLGVIWILVFLAYTIFGYRKYLRKNKITEISLKQKDLFERFRAFQCILFGNAALCLDKKDLMWLKIRVLGILGYSDQPLPPQGSFNAGQKLYGLLVALMTPIIMLTGLIMAFHLGPIWLIQWSIPFHFTAVGLVVSGLLIHVYMGAVFPEEKPAFFSMITGNVSELFLYKHHFDYWKERIVKQCEWLKKTEPDISLTDILPNSLAVKVLEKVEEIGEIEEEEKQVVELPQKFWDPYVAGVVLGLLFIFTYFVYGRGLGASSFLSRTGTYLWNLVAPQYTQSNPYWSRYFHNGHTPLGNFMIFEVIGVLIGGFWSGRRARRNKFEIHKGPRITNKQRIIYAIMGGFLMGLGARIARGCTSGQGLTGGITLAVGGWLFVLVVFAVGYLSAYIFRRYWL